MPSRGGSDHRGRKASMASERGDHPGASAEEAAHRGWDEGAPEAAIPDVRLPQGQVDREGHSQGPFKRGNKSHNRLIRLQDYRKGRLAVLQVEYEEKRVDKDACGNRLS